MQDRLCWLTSFIMIVSKQFWQKTSCSSHLTGCTKIGKPSGDLPHHTTPFSFSPRAHMNFLFVCLIEDMSLSSSSNSLQLIVCSDENYSSRGPYCTPISFEFFDYFYSFNKLLGIPSDCLLKFDVTSMWFCNTVIFFLVVGSRTDLPRLPQSLSMTKELVLLNGV